MRGVRIEAKDTIESRGWNTSTYHLYSHAGTHLDAPKHFGVSEEAVDDFALERCIVPAWVADAAGIAPKEPITLAHLGDIPARIAPGEGLLIRTGWSTRLGQPEYYNALPRVSDELAQWCAERRLPMLGVEPPAVADPLNIEEITRIHRILLGAGVIIVEGLANLESLTQPKVTFAALPLKVAGGDGCPVRAFALEP